MALISISRAEAADDFSVINHFCKLNDMISDIDLLYISDSIRTIQTRIPTPDSNRTTPGTPGMTPSPKPGSPGVRGGNQSKIPVKQQLSGASQTSIEDNWSDGEQVQKSARVSFKEEKDVRNIVSRIILFTYVI